MPLTDNRAIVELLVQKGFRVRGVGRSAARAALFKEKLESNYGKGTFEFAEVADLTAESAFEVALQGAQLKLAYASHTHSHFTSKTSRVWFMLPRTPTLRA